VATSSKNASKKHKSLPRGHFLFKDDNTVVCDHWRTNWNIITAHCLCPITCVRKTRLCRGCQCQLGLVILQHQDRSQPWLKSVTWPGSMDQAKH